MGKYEDGSPAFKVSLDEEGRLHGTLLYWYADGSPSLEATYKRGVPDGFLRMWDKEGALIGSQLWKHGIPVQ